MQNRSQPVRAFPPRPPRDFRIDRNNCAQISRDEINYLITLENTMNSTIIAAVKSLEGVSVADISGVTQGHQLCSNDPWAYGLSVLLVNDDSLAPFHLTPPAQAAIAAILKPSIAAN